MSSSSKNTLKVLCQSKLAYPDLTDPSITAKQRVLDSWSNDQRMMEFQTTAGLLTTLGMGQMFGGMYE